MNELVVRFGDRVDFLTVYLKEAHPTGGWEAPGQPWVVAEAVDTQERLAVARDFFTKVSLRGQLAVDGVENHAPVLFAAMPDRIFVINADRRFVHVQEKGPFGYQPDHVASFLESQLTK